mgnify:CR=1 FL=1|tara:strand:+ start:3310 stop:6255 length:2946 start_codon:yes stop_codon:yes gene_type:complete
MTNAAATAVQQHPAFAELSDAALNEIQQCSTLLDFQPGQPLSVGSQIPHQVFLILSGQARLLVRHRQRTQTLRKAGCGELVGLVSLVRAAGCESVTASTPVQALAIPDKLVLQLLQSEPKFRAFCQQTIWPAELFELLRPYSQDLTLEGPTLRELFQEILADVRLLPNNQEAITAALSANQKVLIASANSERGIGTELSQPQPTPSGQGPIGLRLMAVPASVFNKLATKGADPASLTSTEEASQSRRSKAAGLPLSSALDFGQQNPAKDLELVEGVGTLEEILACFQMLGKLLKLPFRRDSIEKVVRDSLRRGQTPNLQMLGQLGASLGLHVVGAKLPASLGVRMQTPALVNYREGFALAVESTAAGLRLASPKHGWVLVASEQLEETYPEGIAALLMDRTSNTPEQRFGFEWFIPALRRHKDVLIQVLLASFVVQLFTLANPLLIQVIIDKVINQRSLDTLQVLGAALVIVTLLEGILGSLKTFLFQETTNRIDLRLGGEVIDHLLRLPLGYFDKRPVGELGTRVAELEKIRNFLTGQALTTILDAAFSVIYIVVMALYSWVLTAVALAVVPIQVLITLLGAPLFRRQYRQAAQDNAKTQSHLVEVLSGIQTVKAQNVEVVSRWKWQDYYHRYISRTFEKTITGVALTQTSQVLQKLSQLLVLWVGASMVLQGNLTLGQLIAFRIISGYVTQPLLRLSSIWQNLQELRVSFERLADVVDTPQESNEDDKSKIPLPPIHGGVKFEKVGFRFAPGKPEVLKAIDLDIPAGTFVGVVGQSGSGKSTLMKLLPRLYSPEQGRITIDNYDINKVELYSLRRQIGIVPQDPLLFSGSVSDNIALTDTDATSDSIVQAATIACAHDFVMDLAEGYSTNVGERGSALSGGQRQRLAIARTLLSNPKLLVMDEATSALDYDTERRVCDNLRTCLSGCTVFFITHRLSTIRRADRIVMMHEGAVVEQGTHDELMALRGRYYALYRQQEAG